MVDIQFLLLFGKYKKKNDLSKSGFIRFDRHFFFQMSTVDEGTQSQFIVPFRQSSEMFFRLSRKPEKSQSVAFLYKVLSYIFCGWRSVTESWVPCQKVRTHWYLQKNNLTYISSQACEICCKDFYQRQTSGC